MEVDSQELTEHRNPKARHRRLWAASSEWLYCWTGKRAKEECPKSGIRKKLFQFTYRATAAMCRA